MWWLACEYLPQSGTASCAMQDGVSPSLYSRLHLPIVGVAILHDSKVEDLMIFHVCTHMAFVVASNMHVVYSLFHGTNGEVTYQILGFGRGILKNRNGKDS